MPLVKARRADHLPEMIDTIRVGNLSVLRALPPNPTQRPVLFVHGYLVDARVWRGWLEYFAARGIPAYAVNLRGRSGSGDGTDVGGVSVDDYVADAGAVAGTVGAAAVVGHSMGGLIAQKLAAAGAVDAAVLITPAPPRGINILSLDVVRRQIKYLPAIFLSRAIHPSREDLRAIVMNRVPPDQQDALLDLTLPDSGRAGREMSITGVPVDPSRVRCPLMVITASEDRFVPPKVVERIARRYGTPLVIAYGRGHMVILEPDWESLAGRVADWITEHTSIENRSR